MQIIKRELFELKLRYRNKELILLHITARRYEKHYGIFMQISSNYVNFLCKENELSGLGSLFQASCG